MLTGWTYMGNGVNRRDLDDGTYLLVSLTVHGFEWGHFDGHGIEPLTRGFHHGRPQAMMAAVAHATAAGLT